MLKKGADFHFTSDHEKTVRGFLGELSGSKVPPFSDYDDAVSGGCPFMSVTDASKEGLGAVVEQRHLDGDVRPLCFFSRSTLPNECNWTTTELEAGVIVWAVQKPAAVLWNTFSNLQRSSTLAKFVQPCGESDYGQALTKNSQCLHLSDLLQTRGVEFEGRHAIAASSIA